jgi:hypothetical protein
MLEIWYAVPSANKERCESAFNLWKDRGYKTAVLIDKGVQAPLNADLVIEADPYPGYYGSFIQLNKAIGPNADILITGGDDILPDPRDAQEIGEDFFKHFPDGFGIMQPLGDNMPGAETICASPWFGKGWLKRAYRGLHPVWPGYIAFFGDQELREVAKKLGALWQRLDVNQYHHHWSRQGGPEKLPYQAKNDVFWKNDEKLYYERKRGNWPGHEPLQ